MLTLLTTIRTLNLDRAFNHRSPGKEECENLLHVSRVLRMPKPYRHAVHRLDLHRYTLSGPELLQAAVDLQVKPWAVDASRMILDANGFSRLSRKEREGLPGGAHTYFMAGAHNVEQIYKEAAKDVPPVPEPKYSPPHDHSKCRTSWKAFWSNVVAPRLLDDTNPMKLHDLLSFLSNQEIPGMESTCRDAVLMYLSDHPVFSFVKRVAKKVGHQLEGLIGKHEYEDIDREEVTLHVIL